MRYFLISFVVFVILSIYKIGKEIIRTELLVQEVGIEGVSIPYNIAGALGQATSSAFWSLLLILILYFLMTRKKKITTFRDKYPIKFIIGSIFIIFSIQYFVYVGEKDSSESAMDRQERVANSIRENVRENNVEKFKNKMKQFGYDNLYSEIDKIGLDKFIEGVLAGINRKIKRNNGSFKVDLMTTQEYASLENSHTIIMNYTVKKNLFIKHIASDYKNLKDAINSSAQIMKKMNGKRFCSIKAFNIIMEKGIEFEFRQKLDDGTPFPSYIINYDYCKKILE